ncbi:AI-2E family transporter [Candidatus Woesebacteria bacterium]|nr:AI-2E family transporter [Candidatus Woesebacteria bacterium]
MPRKIEISHRTIIFAVLFLVFLWFLYYIKDLILELFVALLIMTILNPFVTRLSKLKIPRAISVFVAYVVVFGLFGAALAGIIPPLIEQTSSFANNLPRYLSSLGIGGYINEQLTGELLSQLGSIPGQLVKVGLSVFSNVFAVITVLIFAFYLLLARDKLDDQLGFLFGEERKGELARIMDLLESKLGGWARGELALMALVGISNYIGLMILGIPFALPLAILAGLLEIIPYLGPVIAAVPAIVIGFSISPLMGLAVTALAFLIQQLENYLFVPKVMEKSVGVSPIVTLLALAIGFRIAGVVGAVISVPVVLTIQVLSKKYLFSKE